MDQRVRSSAGQLPLPECGMLRDPCRRVLLSIVRYGYAPAILLGAGGSAVHLAATGSPAWMLLGVVAASVTVSFAVERILPYDRAWNRDHGDRWRDFAHAFVNEAFAYTSIGLVPVLASWSCIPSIWPKDLPFLAQVLIAVLIADMGITLAHYASHRIEILWRFHAVHHSIRRCYGLNGLLKHPLHQALETVAGVTPLLLLGIPESVALALATCVALQLLLQHSNVDYETGPLRGVLATNRGHRLHHLRWPVEGDVNFGLFTLFWDHLLGTYRAPNDRSVLPGDLGIEDSPDYPDGYLAQLLEPFRPRRTPVGAQATDMSSSRS